MSINISPRQFTDSWLAQKIVRLLAETGFPAERLVVEVTESSLFADIDLARTIVHSLKNQGIALALDDFGTGFSSLSHLSALPFDKIKIDRTFVATIGKDRAERGDRPRRDDDGAGARRAGRGRGDRGCRGPCRAAADRLHVGQGWYFGKPMPAEDAEHLLRHRAHGVPRRRTAPRARLAERSTRAALSRRGTAGSRTHDARCHHGKNSIK